MAQALQPGTTSRPIPRTSRPILITGTSGQVGGELMRQLRSLPQDSSLSQAPLLAPSREQMDMADPASIHRFVREANPCLILNPAAYTAVDLAEREPELAFAINRNAVHALGQEALACDAAMVHFSTDYVFPGTGTTPWREQDATAPLNIYGASKLAGEQALEATGAAHLILRTSWVYGATGKNFVRTILKLAREREELSIVSDQIGSPTSSSALAEVTIRLIEQLEAASGTAAVRKVQGVYHASCAGETSWHGLAEESVRLMQEREPKTRFAHLKPILTAAYPTPARRPLNSRLNCSRLRETFGLTLPEWQPALVPVLAVL